MRRNKSAHIKENLSSLIKGIPCVGTKVLTLTERLDESLKNLLIPGIFFEQLGFRYFGPLEGHNIQGLLETLRNVFSLEGHNIQGLLETLRNVFSIQEPTLIHIITKKGKGYEPAEQFPERFHSVPAFNIKTGEFANREFPTYTEIFGETLLELARQDKNIVAITAAMELGTGLDKFRKEFPKRFFDVGIAEQHAVTFAGGLSKQKIRPFVAIYSTFLQRAYDQIIHDICLQNLPVVFVVSNAGIVGEDGATHHGIFDFAYLGQLPNLTILAPKDGEELKDMLIFAAKEQKGPIAIRYPKSVNSQQSTVNIEEKIGKEQFLVINQKQKIELGKGEVLRSGKDVVIIAIGSMVYPCLEAGNMLFKQGIDCGVVNSRFLKPLDASLLLNISSKTNRFVTVEEHSLEGGFGSRILEFFADRNINLHIKRIGLPCKFIEHGKREELLARYGLTAEGIAKNIKKWMRVTI